MLKKAEAWFARETGAVHRHAFAFVRAHPEYPIHDVPRLGVPRAGTMRGDCVRSRAMDRDRALQERFIHRNHAAVRPTAHAELDEDGSA